VTRRRPRHRRELIWHDLERALIRKERAKELRVRRERRRELGALASWRSWV
jgi:hypothetical protein